MRDIQFALLAAVFLSIGGTLPTRSAQAQQTGTPDIKSAFGSARAAPQGARPAIKRANPSVFTDVERMIAEHDCTKLQMEYGVFADRGDIEGYVGLFAPDASITVPGHPVHVGLDAIRESVKQVIARGTWRHMETNSVINVIDANTATGVVYSTVYSDAAPWNSTDLLPVRPPYLIGEYVDTFKRTAAGWKFHSRVLKLKFGKST